MKKHHFNIRLLSIMILITLTSCSKDYKIVNNNIVFEVNAQMQTRVNSIDNDESKLMPDFSNSEQLITDKFPAQLFSLTEIKESEINDSKGSGKQYQLTGELKAEGYNLTKTLVIYAYDSFPGMLVTKVIYANTGTKNIAVKSWINNNYQINSHNDTPNFWSFQGSSTSARQDWLLPVDSTFHQTNFMGMNNTDYGGGIPIVDVWRRDKGIAIGHIEMKPELVSLPVDKNQYDAYVNIAIRYDFDGLNTLKPGETIETLSTFVKVHKGDCFATLSDYSEFMQKSGLRFVPEEPEAFEVVWCAWGYERRFTLDEVLGTLPKVKEFGIKWVDIDDGYQKAEGDWDVPAGRFPNGSSDMRKLVDKIHSMGMKAKIWWAPLAVDPGSDLYQKNHDIALMTNDWAPQYITWWDSYYMSPGSDKTIEHTKQVLQLFLQKWDFDGLKMDGQHLNCVPADYQSGSNLSDGRDANEKLPAFFKMVYETSRSYKPHAVLQLCPCGCVASFYNIPYINQGVASDPSSSWQVRSRSKVYKALRPGIAFYGDHVERYKDTVSNFASQIGCGAVLGTKFTWPKDNPYVTEGKFVLQQKDEAKYKKWIGIYNIKMLSKGKYLGNLYDLGYDMPETHVIAKGDTLYYAFYNDNWKGNVSFKGLTQFTNYRLIDYYNNKELGVINSTNPTIEMNFEHFLLIEAIPETKN